ncbi:hypothetical protein [Oceanobacillus locisalsi]|uniref:Uncharacterized protein n=1 Tax=Oceanobacillus locisalsi TaxID=546107 RepID=A0ABW3NKP8_9BACI
MTKMEWFGLFFVIITMVAALFPAVYIIQFFIAAPQLRYFFYISLSALIIGFGTGIYGLYKTRHDKNN